MIRAVPINPNLLVCNFKEAASITKDSGMKNAIKTNINNIVYNKCEKIILNHIDRIQNKICIGFECTIDEDVNNMCYYLEKVNPKLYEKYLKRYLNNKPVEFTRNNKTHYRLPNNYTFRFICKDKTIIIYRRNISLFGSGNGRIFFYGKHKQKHAEFFNSFCKKNETKTVNTYNLSIGKQNDLVFEEDVIKGIPENAIIFPEKQQIFDYIDAWIGSENYFYERGINHKIGILLYGDPGTGKTTFAKVLATKYNLSLIKLSLNNLSKVIVKEEFWEQIEQCIVVLEDIDVLISKRDESVTSEDKENFQALLQLLDGINNCKQTIFLATTNYIDRLDSALIRDGRFDIKIEMKNFDYSEAVKMCNKFEVNPEVILRDEQFPINPAYLQNKIITLQMKEINEKLKQKAQRIGSNKCNKENN